MGSGEDWKIAWRKFTAGLGPEPEIRLQYLRRHRPAPITWADEVYQLLFPGTGLWRDHPDLADERRAQLMDLGVIGSDVAFRTWVERLPGHDYPWEAMETPELAARYCTHEFWFWSRHLADLRTSPEWAAPALPDAWRECALALQSGEAGAFDSRLGLLMLARMLCAGRVREPWHLGLDLGEFEDSYEEDMGFVDAFRLWCFSAIDDELQLRQQLSGPIPPEWEQWLAQQATLF